MEKINTLPNQAVYNQALMKGSTYKLIWIAFIVVLAAIGCTENTQKKDIPFNKGKWVDLTHTFYNGMPHYPNFGFFENTVFFDGLLPDNEYMKVNELHLIDHIGTHLDAPQHFSKEKFDNSSIPLDNLIGQAVVIDLREKCKNPNYRITINDVKNWEKLHHTTINNMIVLINTGYHHYYPKKSEKYFGTGEGTKTLTEGEVSHNEINFPSISQELGQWLATERKIKSLGLDVPSTDTNKNGHPVHIALANANIPTFENIANLDIITGKQNLFVLALPMKIKDGSGGPLRIVAYYEN